MNTQILAYKTAFHHWLSIWNSLIDLLYMACLSWIDTAKNGSQQQNTSWSRQWTLTLVRSTVNSDNANNKWNIFVCVNVALGVLSNRIITKLSQTRMFWTEWKSDKYIRDERKKQEIFAYTPTTSSDQQVPCSLSCANWVNNRRSTRQSFNWLIDWSTKQGSTLHSTYMLKPIRANSVWKQTDCLLASFWIKTWLLISD